MNIFDKKKKKRRLLECAGKGDFETVSSILEFDKEIVNCCDTIDGSTPLILASKCGYTDIVKELIVNDAELDIPDGDGWTALHWSCASGHV